jgi:hypothetical protein
MKKPKLLPLLLTLILLSFWRVNAQVPADSNWSDMFSGFIDVGGPINAIYADNSGTYVCGAFQGVEQVYTLNGIAMWVDSSWRPIVENGKIGVHGIPQTIIRNDNNLFVGGYFDSIGNTKAHSIARWNGNWYALGNGINGAVSKIVFKDTILYAVGSFDSAGTVSARNIAKWNGSSWSSVGGAPNGRVDDILFADTNMYIIGAFDSVGGVPARHIARWNGNTWSALGGTIKGDVYAICSHGNNIIIGGVFDTIGTAIIHNIASWNGTQWSALGSGINGDGAIVLALAVDEDNIYAAGSFSLVGGDTIRGIAKWSTTSETWSPLGSGIPELVHTLYQYDHKIFAGGAFWDIGNTGTRYIAVWDETQYQDTTEDTYLMQFGYSLGNNYPNPTGRYTTFPISINKPGNVVVSILDGQGNQVAEVLRQYLPKGDYTVRWDNQNSQPGVYYCRVLHNSQMQIKIISVIK